jgi:hypothetical protein
MRVFMAGGGFGLQGRVWENAGKGARVAKKDASGKKAKTTRHGEPLHAKPRGASLWGVMQSDVISAHRRLPRPPPPGKAGFGSLRHSAAVGEDFNFSRRPKEASPPFIMGGLQKKTVSC